ncbi:MAG: transposase [bacterium]|nr:transposase [bacterium]
MESIIVRLFKLTDKRAADIAEEIEQDREQRRDGYEDQMVKVATLVEELIAEESDIGQFEKRLSEELMLLGLKATELYLAEKRQVPERKMNDAGGQLYKYAKEKKLELRSIFGLGSYTSSLYERGENPESKRQLVALDSQVGLLPAGGLSPNLGLELVNLVTRMPYDQAKEVMEYFRPYVPSKRSICGIIDLIGPHAEGVLDELECEAGEVVEIQVDARGAPKIRQEEYAKRCKPHKKRPRGQERPKGKRRRYRVGEKKARPRLTKGQKSKNKKRVTVGVISSLNRQADGSWEGPFGKYIARFGDGEQVFKRLRQALDRMGPQVKRVVFYSDGDPQYAVLARKYFPTATIVVDFYHVSEYLWRAGETIYKEGSKELIGFVEQLKEMVCNGEVEEVLSVLMSKLETISKRGPGTKGRRKRMAQSINYLSKRVWQMPYKELREQKLEIGSGMIESAVRQVVALRLEGPGMKWGERRDQLILHLLCVRLSGAWNTLVEVIRQWAHQPRHRRRLTPVGVSERKRQQQTATSSTTMGQVEAKAA